MERDRLAPIALIEFPFDHRRLGRNASVFQCSLQTFGEFGFGLIHIAKLRMQRKYQLR